MEAEIQYHHQRSSDRRRGRAAENEGTLFTYESILPRQQFEGAVLGDVETIARLRSVMPQGGEINLGRSRAAQYGGGGVFGWIGEPQKLTAVREISGWQDSGTSDDSTSKILVSLLSPLLAVNSHGHPSPEFPVEQFSEALTDSPTALRPEKVFVRTRWQGGYLAHQRLPIQQFPALQEGSVFIFASNVPISSSAMRKAESRSYGFRTEDGFGRIGITAWTPDVRKFRFAAAPNARRPRVNPTNQPMFQLAFAIFRRKLEQKIAANAWASASAPDLAINGLSSHLIARVRTMLQTMTPEQLNSALSDFRRPAANQLKSCFVGLPGGGRITLFDLLQSGGPVGKDLFNSAYLDNFPREIQQAAKDDEALVASLPAIWLRSYFAAIGWRKRKPLARLEGKAE